VRQAEAGNLDLPGTKAWQVKRAGMSERGDIPTAHCQNDRGLSAADRWRGSG
jgi:hypothetical protein